MAVGKSRRLVYVSTAIAAAVILILAVILLQQPIEPKTTPPPTLTAPGVSTIAASGVQQTSATLNGDLWNLGTSSYSVVGFVYGTDPALSATANETAGNETATGAFYQAIDGLTAATAYYFKAWARGDGFSLGTVMTFTTKTPSAPPARAPSVTTDAASSISTSEAILNGNLADLGTAASVTVGFRYGTDPTLASATNLSSGAQSAVTAFDAGVSGLIANTTYYVQAWADGQGFAVGSIVSFKTTAPSGNGNQVPPGWAHAACPTVPDQAPAHGVRTRCELNMTYGQWKKENPGNAGPVYVPGWAVDANAPGNSGSHRSGNSRTW